MPRRGFLVQAEWPSACGRHTLEQLRAAICAAEGLTAEEFDRELADLDRPEYLCPSSIMWAVWGRRP